MSTVAQGTVAAADTGVRPQRARRAALRGGIAGNFVDQMHIFLPVTTLGPALPVLAGDSAVVSSVAYVVMATLIGRPVGAMIFGPIADTLGRVRTTRIAIAGTAISTGVIALLPTHQVLGVWTMVLVIALRFLGGVFLAGEYTSAIPLAMEWSRPRQRGLVSGLVMSMSPWAQASVAFVTVGLLLGLGRGEYAAWGWRIPFAVGALASVLMLVYYTRRVVDANNFTPARFRADRPGLRDVLSGRWARSFWQVFSLMTGLWLMTNMAVILMAQRLSTDGHLDSTGVALIMGAAAVVQALVMVASGHLSTVLGRRRLLVLWAAVALVASPPLWLWVTSASSGLLDVGLGVAALQAVTVCAYGPMGAYLTERFPTPVRATAYGTAYSLSIVVPALYPYYLPGLARIAGHQGAPIGLLVLGAALVLVASALGPRLSPSDLDGDVDSVAAGVAR
ncbi:MFS transporter [Aestuariimicrobium kwangyangense]|uniref:MFS transporter n=1 Tax=Aestuariimicrobium kwangyangense TaxID=396389 RepID=UPI0003B480B0|nr:MFS transporter [Aestuariimicrobium kwangyangense]